MHGFLPGLKYELERHKSLGERAMAELNDEQFFRQPHEAANSIAMIVKHIGGNLRSRWTDFLTADGEKPDRHRDREFEIEAADDRTSLMEGWDDGWRAVTGAVDSLKPDDLQRTITIREEKHTVTQALLRGLTHTVYHTGQILYLCRMLNPESRYLTIAPGQSGAARGGYLSPKDDRSR